MTVENYNLKQPAITGAGYIAHLNEHQRQAVEHTQGALLVLAGAGTGKTSVLTARVAHLLANNLARPYQILTVTFTNKAAREIKERVIKASGINGDSAFSWFGTFHSLSAKMLRRNAEAVDLKANFTIIDKDDQIRLAKQLIIAANIDEKKWPAKHLVALIDNWKNRALTPQKVPEAHKDRFGHGRAIELYAIYQARLKDLNAVDFGDLLLKSIELLKIDHILAYYGTLFRYIMVDEYQDTNVAQYMWLRLLSQTRGNICCVGDDDQSIYGWRGAEVDNILRFEHDFANARIIRLERNYRSTAHILDTASHLIANNRSRLGKTLIANGDHGDKVTLMSFWDSEEEARGISSEIEKLQAKISFDDIAILVRASFQMREVEDRFTTIGLPYRVIGGPKFYERAEIRDAIAYIRLINQPNDDLAFERIINVPRRGLGDATLRIIHNHARQRGVSLTTATAQLITIDEGLRPRQRSMLTNFAKQIDNWRYQLDKISPGELAAIIIEESGYLQMWRNSKEIDAPGRIENIKELLRSIDEFPTISGFLEHVALLTTSDTDNSDGAINVMTLHAAKGLEFDTVFLPGWEEGLFPHQKPLIEQGERGLEEERRLAYVGITRAKRKLFISSVSSRRIHGLWQPSLPSRFIDELPPESITAVNNSSPGGYGGYNSYVKLNNPVNKSGHQPLNNISDADELSYLNHNANSFTMATADKPGGRPKMTSGRRSSYQVGTKVRHGKFGIGVIKAVDHDKLSIMFSKVGIKRVMASFVSKAE